MRNKVQNIVFYLLVLLAGVWMIYWAKAAKEDLLIILLYPHARITQLYYNIPLVYAGEAGYLSQDGSFSIGRECMGSSFTVMLFGMIAVTFARCFSGAYKMAWFAASLVTAVFIGVSISCIRIIASVPFINHPKFALFHSAIGISLYFLALVLTYGILNKLIRSNRHETVF